ncbi:hypothetical protein G7046_g6418 [Stylonectria norvegica]|nr:hypothetical protein G7046_g6418 [Stylonectria norvegica]
MAPKYAKEQPSGFTNKIERVAIVGAGGTIGKFIAEALVDGGKHTVTAITRKDSASKLPAGVKSANVDYNDEETLVAALKGQQFLIITMAVAAPPDTSLKLVAAAAKAGVPWVMPNVFGTDVTNKKLSDENLTGNGFYPVIEAIQKAGVSSWIGLVSSFWYEFSVATGENWYGFNFKEKKMTFYDDGNTRINTTTWLQTGRAMAKLLSLKELPEDENDTSPTISKWRDAPLRISSFRLSQREMLDSIERVTGTTDKDWTIEYESSKARYERGMERLKAGDRSAFAIVLYSRVFFPNGDGDFETSHGIENKTLGLPVEDLDEASKRAVEMVENGYNYFTKR